MEYFCNWNQIILGNIISICLETFTMRPLSFEKDDDENGHIDFMTAASVSHTHYQIQWDFNYKFTLLIVIVLRGKG